ncbi:MAG: hypothetical protein PHC64_00835 [Candidatus Gastranaerophilales bacterium]|nr:hypothetical protein [Candidatus Gastranaerophilales bacterium]
MKAIPISKADNSCRKPNLSLPRTKFNRQMPNDGVSFGSLKSGVSGAFDWIDSKGFFVEFLIIDALSMIIPRVLIGLNRDREKTGKINYKAGIEETGREVISGPSMFLIPMGILAAYRHLNPISQTKINNLSALNHNMGQVIDSVNDIRGFTNKEQLQKDLAGKLFDDAFGKLKLENKADLKTKFIDLLIASVEPKPKSKIGQWLKTKMVKLLNITYADDFESAQKAFTDHVAFIYNRNKTETPTDLSGIKLTIQSDDVVKDIQKTKDYTAGQLFADFHNYSKSILKKLTRKDFAQQVIEVSRQGAKKLLETAKIRTSHFKLLTGLTGFLFVGVFLTNLPKLYMQGKISPAMESAKRAQGEAVAQGGTNENS